MKKFMIPMIATAVLVGGVSLVAITSEKAIVTVNGTDISQATLDDILATVPAENLVGKEAEIRQAVLDNLVNQELVLQEAESLSVSNDSDYKEELAELTRNFTFNYTIKREVEKLVTDEMLKAEYEALKPVYNIPTVRARHILLETEAEAKEVIATVAKGEKDFATLAMEKSIDPSAKQNGGDLGWFRKVDMVPEFGEKAFSMKKGTYTNEPVKTQFGWHVILLLDKKESNMPEFAAIEPQLRLQSEQKVARTYVTELRNKADIVYADGAKPEATAAVK